MNSPRTLVATFVHSSFLSVLALHPSLPCVTPPHPLTSCCPALRQDQDQVGPPLFRIPTGPAGKPETRVQAGGGPASPYGLAEKNLFLQGESSSASL